MSKGSKRRPRFISDEDFEDSWNNIFGRKKPKGVHKTHVHRDRKREDKKSGGFLDE